MGNADQSAAPALLASSVTKRFGRKLALDAATLSVPTGHVTALVGSNGAGKTTLMRTWLAFERPDSGHVEVGGLNPLKRRTEALRRIGFVPQKASVLSGLSVADHLAMARALQRSFDERYARRRLDQLAIPLGQRAETLSGGQAAQLGLALALGTRRKILLLDEPLASLDALARREFLQVMLDAVSADGLTVLLSTHLVTDIEAACDRLAILGRGRILLDSTLEQAVQSHRVVELGASPAGADVVGSFSPNRQLRPVTLVRLTGPTAGTSIEGAATPSVEDVVLGYLAASRHPEGRRLS
jgi:ABC-2 type transport system ATP-binding protein